MPPLFAKFIQIQFPTVRRARSLQYKEELIQPITTTRVRLTLEGFGVISIMSTQFKKNLTFAISGFLLVSFGCKARKSATDTTVAASPDGAPEPLIIFPKEDLSNPEFKKHFDAIPVEKFSDTCSACHGEDLIRGFPGTTAFEQRRSLVRKADLYYRVMDWEHTLPEFERAKQQSPQHEFLERFFITMPELDSTDRQNLASNPALRKELMDSLDFFRSKKITAELARGIRRGAFNTTVEAALASDSVEEISKKCLKRAEQYIKNMGQTCESPNFSTQGYGVFAFALGEDSCVKSNCQWRCFDPDPDDVNCQQPKTGTPPAGQRVLWQCSSLAAWTCYPKKPL